ncbi:MAG TPA: transcription initiation factor IIB [Thermoplasmatales archaeon]|nr:MAG: transcription initiation factor IIB [Thermoplasmata archaeon]RLF60709.1 MAG: transcription initiation factor IIB [Thermoplasmata archaeon]HDN50985.1 transcription initiation factor IIB [Thermoplasmatales archaeon]
MTRKQTLVEENVICPECGSSHLARDYGRGELVCENCGLVIDEAYIDQGPEWRAFDAEQRKKRARTGAPLDYSLPDKGLNTVIGWQNKDSYGKSIPTRNRAQLYRLRKWQRRIRFGGTSEKSLTYGISEIDKLSSLMTLSRNVREAAAMVYRRAVEKNLIRGRKLEGVVAAAIYAACRQCGVPHTLDEISLAAKMERKEIGKTYRFLTRELTLKLMPTSPQDYVGRFCGVLELSGDAQAKTMEIVRQAEEKELTSGRGPTGVAAAAIYIAATLCGERRTQREVADVAGVTEVTIRNRYKELAEKLDLDVVL